MELTLVEIPNENLCLEFYQQSEGHKSGKKNFSTTYTTGARALRVTMQTEPRRITRRMQGVYVVVTLSKNRKS